MIGPSPLRALLADSRGNVLVLSALAMPLMIGAAGLAMDTIQLTLIQRQLQRLGRRHRLDHARQPRRAL